MSVHITVRGERVAAVLARERSFTAVDQHVSVQTGTGTEHLAADSAGEALLVLGAVVGADVHSEVMLGG